MDARQQTGRLAERVVENKEPVCQRRDRVNRNKQAQTPTPGCPAARQGKAASSQVKAGDPLELLKSPQHINLSLLVFGGIAGFVLNAGACVW